MIKCSHIFNLLDARGAISVTERATYIARVRDLSRRVAQAFYLKRKKAGFDMAEIDYLKLILSPDEFHEVVNAREVKTNV